MRLKKGVRIGGLRPEISVAMMIIDSIYQARGVELVVTSLTDGNHKKRSDHYDGRAFDCRTRFFGEEERPEVAEEAKAALGDDFIVVLEKTHMHISWRPDR